MLVAPLQNCLLTKNQFVNFIVDYPLRPTSCLKIGDRSSFPDVNLFSNFAAMAKNDSNDLKKIISHAKEYGFIFPSSETYDGLAATYDYGQNGAELKNNIRTYWWKSMVQMNENIVGIDAAIFMHPTTWKASARYRR